MTRLVDYFFIIGVDDKSDLYDGKDLKGTIVQKFPEQDWKDVPSPQGLEVFCEPSGWEASAKPKEPKFHITVLTDVEGKPSYLACLCFYECVSHKKESTSLNIDLNENSNLADVKEAIKTSDYTIEELFYVPKYLCVVSRNRYYQTLKNCLITIFNSYLLGQTELLEKMIGCMIGFVHVPPPGGPKLTFSIGGSDSHVIQPPLSGDIPHTQESVAILFNQLGIHSIMLVFTALVTECKILLLSSSFTHLTMAAEALVSLLYPLTYNYVFIPILPSSLLDFLTAPTPFLMGANTLYEDQLPEIFDVVKVNIDEGYVIAPDSINLSAMPDPYYTQILNTLKMILTPSLYTSDILFPAPETTPTLALQDKQLRAVFLKFFAEITAGYRACLTLIRVHPSPVISFNKLAFMEKRGFLGDEFISKVLDSVGFSTMTQARGPPYRVIDMFDRLVVEFLPASKEKDIQELLNDLNGIVVELTNNEASLEDQSENKIPKVDNELLKQPLKLFPLLSETKINSYITKNESSTQQAKIFKAPVKEPSQVPMSSYDQPVTHYINQRRLEVIKDCIQYIYDNKISEARKAIPSVKRALGSKGAQLALCNELETRVKNDSSLLDHDQYNLLIYLINCALQDDNTVNSTNVAARMVPLVAAFHRKLGPSVIQFAYTSIQDHSVWSNLQFWEEAFYNEAQRKIIELYAREIKNKKVLKPIEQQLISDESKKMHSTNDIESLQHQTSPEESKTVKRSLSETECIKLLAEKTTALLSPNESPSSGHHRNSMLISPGSTSSIQRVRTGTIKSNSSLNGDNTEQAVKKSSLKDLPDAMKLAADLLGEWGTKTEEEKERLIYEEESIIYSLTMLFAQHMMYLRVPTNACVDMRKIQHMKRLESERRLQQMANAADRQISEDTISIAKPAPSVMDAQSTYMGGSVLESSSWGSTNDLIDGSVLYGESVKDSTSKFILRFVERVCIEAGVTAQHLRSLTTNIPMLVGMHIESLEEVYRETKDAPTYKAKITKPSLLPGEKLQFEGLRCYLITDGRELGVRIYEDSNVKSSLNDTFDADKELSTSAANGGPCLLPAEGALFLTNYRVIFKGTPLDQYASEMVVTRAFPIGALMKEKKVNEEVAIMPNITCDGFLQIRSSTMQLMKLAFDEEVLPETIENFRNTMKKSRWPPSVYNTFAFNYKAPPILHRTLSQRQQSIMKTHKALNSVTNLKKKASTRGIRQRTAQADDATTRQYEAVSKEGGLTSDEDDDRQQVLIEQEYRGADRLKESPICKDYERLGLGGITKISSSPWRLSMANFHYNVCRSYPAIVVIPCRVTDDSLIKVAKNHRLNQFPAAVWRHRRTKGTLLRSGTINRLTAVLRAGQDHANQSGNITDDEQFFSEIVNATHLYQHKGQTQTVSNGAALSLTDDFNAMFDDSAAFKRTVDEAAEIKNWEPAHLYIFTRGSRVTKMESSQKVVVVNVELHDIAQVKTSFSKLSKVCCPSSKSNESKFLSSLEDSKWLNQISSVLQLSCAIANLIDIQGSSCLVALGDGSEVTSQIVSLVQILSDPYYRTIAGFKVLIEKDWLAFGYRFSHRGNHTMPQQPAIAPFFFQFLDCVHQIVEQYPHAFEFNNYFIKLIAYHQTSMRFNTFFLDTEHERYQHGWFPDSELNNPSSTAKSEHSNSLKMKSNIGRNKKEANLRAEQLAQQQKEQKKKKSSSVSLWDYLELQSQKYTIFQGFTYHPNLHRGVLQPFCNISNLNIWDYLTAENLYTGPTYDVEMIGDFEMASPSNEVSTANPDVDREDSQRCLTGCYGSTQEFPRDEVTYLLSELGRLKEEMDESNQQWTDTWSSLDVRRVLKYQVKSMNWTCYWAKERRMALHKRATIDIVMKGKVTESGQIRTEFGFEHPHAFVLKNYLKSSICNYCLQQIAGFNAGLQCSHCGFNVHTKCQSMVPAQCPKHPSFADQPANELSRSSHSLQGGDSSRNPRNFKGTLYKRGHLLRQWKPRWFVLDAERNHLTYYDSESNTQLQGYIDLGELRTSRLVSVPQGAPSKIGDARSFFELETTKRVYHLLAPNGETAKEWVDRLNALNV